MKILWVRGNENINFHHPYTWFCLGVRGAGKSRFLEHLAEIHLKQEHTIVDLFGSRDGENLAWLRSPWRKEKRILLLSVENAIVEAPSDVDVKPYTAFSLKDLENYDLVINSPPLYPTLDSELFSVNHVIEKLWRRLKLAQEARRRHSESCKIESQV